MTMSQNHHSAPALTPSLAGRRIVLGVSASIAIVKSLDLISRLRKAGAEVRVCMTPSACRMIPPVTYATVTEHPVYAEMWDAATAHTMEHLSWSKWGELMVIAPATAHALATLAHGLSDTPLATTALAFGGPMLVCPAMNPAMWLAAATQANVATLRARGVHFCGPAEGLMACGDTGPGRLSEVDDIVAAIGKLLIPAASISSLAGMTVVMTVGPTREHIDAVRFISNASTGRMGFELALAAARRGARVVAVTGPTPIAPPQHPAIEVVRVTSALDMHAAVMQRLDAAHIAIFTAAVADFRPATSNPRKSKKSEIDAEAGLRLLPNPDIAAEAGARNVPGQLRVGFAAETHDVEAYAREKLARKRLHVIVANDVSQPGQGFATETNAVTIFHDDARPPQRHELQSKADIATRILDAIEQRLVKPPTAASCTTRLR